MSERPEHPLSDAIGTRVYAICDANNERVRIFGHGVFEAIEVPPENVDGFNLGLPNPKIRLDNGEIVWGCQCWWGPEDEFENARAGREIEVISIHDPSLRPETVETP